MPLNPQKQEGPSMLTLVGKIVTNFPILVASLLLPKVLQEGSVCACVRAHVHRLS